MKKVLIILITVLVIAAVVVAFFATDIFNADDNPPNEMQRGARIFGEVVSIDGNRITMNELTLAGGMMMDGQGGRVVMSGGQGGDGVHVVGENEIEYRDEDGNLVEPAYDATGEPFADYNGEDERPTPRIAGADAETDRIRTSEGDGQQMMVMGEFPPFERAGHAVSVVIPRNMPLIVGIEGDEAEVSSLQRGDIVLVLYDDEGRMASVRLLPDARIGE